MFAKYLRSVKRFVRRLPRQSALSALRILVPGIASFAAIVAGMQAVAQEAANPPRPNIVFILADDMGYGDAGFMGQKWILTPNIDRLAEEGVVFTHHYAGAPMSTPARCCLMTGFHNGHVTLPNNARPEDTLRPGDITVAEVLKGAGYATHFIGKWGLGGATPSPDFEGTGEIIEEARHGLPTRKGFDTSLAFLDQLTAHRYFPRYIWRGEEKLCIEGNEPKAYEERGTYIHDLFTEEALNIVRNADGEQPFYLQLSYTIPHRETKFPKSPMPADEPDPNAWNPYEPGHWDGMDPPPLEVDKAYAAMITFMDKEVGQVVEAIDANPAIAGNTLIIFTSDNGPQFTDGHTAEMFDSSGALRGKKFYLWEGGIRVPFAARWRGAIEPGRVSDHPSYFADFMPTAAELAGAAVPYGIDGISYVPALLGRDAQETHDYMIWTQPVVRDEKSPVGAVRKARDANGRIWKLAALADGTHELYDLAADQGETHDRASEFPAVVEELKKVLERQSQGPPAVANPVFALVGDIEHTVADASGRGYMLDLGTVEPGSSPVMREFRVANAAFTYSAMLHGETLESGLTDARLEFAGGEYEYLVGDGLSESFSLVLRPDRPGVLEGQYLMVSARRHDTGAELSGSPFRVEVRGEVLRPDAQGRGAGTADASRDEVRGNDAAMSGEMPDAVVPEAEIEAGRWNLYWFLAAGVALVYIVFFKSLKRWRRGRL